MRRVLLPNPPPPPSKKKTLPQVNRYVQSNPAISNSVNSKSPLFRRKIEFPWIYPSPLRFPGYFETPLFRTFFHFPWDFEIAGFDCISNMTEEDSSD